MKKLIYLVLLLSCVSLNAQFYQFTNTTGTYSNLSGETTILNNDWNDTLVTFKIPFYFRLFTTNINAGVGDSIQFTDDGSVFFTSINNGLFEIFKVDMHSRGTGKSPISFKVEGTSPNQILKVQYKNAGFDADAPGYNDSMNFQLWIYETTYLIEFRYGPNSVKAASYNGENGAYVDLVDPLVLSNFISLEDNPSNPTVRTLNLPSQKTLDGTPPNGTIYRFTPSAFHTGIKTNGNNDISIIQNKIVVPAGTEVSKIEILNMNGQIIESFINSNQVDISGLPRGIYIINIESNKGVSRQKLAL